MVINAYLGFFPGTRLKDGGRQWFECRFIDRFKGATATAGQLLEGAGIELFQQVGNSNIEISQTKKLLVAQLS